MTSGELLIPPVSSNAQQQSHTPHHLLMDQQTQYPRRLIHQGSQS
jgi:hypothetical protein